VAKITAYKPISRLARLAKRALPCVLASTTAVIVPAAGMAQTPSPTPPSLAQPAEIPRPPGPGDDTASPGDPTPTSTPTPTPTPAARPAPATAPAELGLPGLALDREAGRVELAARVVGQDAEWLELIACTPRSREHEALLVVEARPSHVHLALTLLGLTPGQPRTATPLGPGRWQTHPAHGPGVAITVRVDTPDGPIEAPIQRWYAVDQRPPHDDAFLFTGSLTRTHAGQTHYLADLSGSVISLVHFGDDTLARRTGLTQSTDAQALAPTAAVPPNGTPVTLILTPTLTPAPATGTAPDLDLDAPPGTDAAPAGESTPTGPPPASG
jgi:hypothetical protein